MALFHVDTDSPAGGDGTTDQLSGATRAYPTLAAALAARWASAPTEPIDISCKATSGVADSAAVTINSFATSFANRLRIFAAAGHEASEVWSTSKYRLERAASFNNVLTVHEAFVILDRLQVKNTASLSSQARGIWVGPTAAGGEARVLGCHVWLSSTSGTDSEAACVFADNNAATKIIVANNILHGGVLGFRTRWNAVSGRVVAVYNNLAIDQVAGGTGFLSDAAGPTVRRFINNAAQGVATGFNITGDGLTLLTNLSEDANSPNVSLRNKVITFVNEGAGNYGLSGSDTSARDAGTNLSADAQYAFAVDINGTARSGTWDIGPHEFVSGGGGGGSTLPVILHHLRQQRAR